MSAAYVVSVVLPVHTPSVANLREHWAKRAKRSKHHRTVAYHRLFDAGGHTYGRTESSVTLTRISPRRLDDDNLRGALKAVRDGVADWFGVPDNDPRIKWEYSQERGKPKEHGVRITVEWEL